MRVVRNKQASLMKTSSNTTSKKKNKDWIKILLCREHWREREKGVNQNNLSNLKMDLSSYITMIKRQAGKIKESSKKNLTIFKLLRKTWLSMVPLKKRWPRV